MQTSSTEGTQTRVLFCWLTRVQCPSIFITFGVTSISPTSTAATSPIKNPLRPTEMLLRSFCGGFRWSTHKPCSFHLPAFAVDCDKEAKAFPGQSRRVGRHARSSRYSFRSVDRRGICHRSTSNRDKTSHNSPGFFD